MAVFGLHEANLEAHSGRFASQMERTFELDLTNSEELSLEEWESRPLWAKVLEWGLAPLRLFG